MTKTKKSENPMPVGHHFGDRIWGYEVFADGRIKLSPSICDPMISSIERTAGLRNMTNSFNLFIADQYHDIAKVQDEFWNALVTDIGIDLMDSWGFDLHKMEIYKVKEQKS